MKKFKLLLAFFYACFSSVSWAQMNGSGTEADPYQICNADDLFDVSMNLSAYYVLMNDIDLTEWIAEESPTYGWLPISTFTGSFDGNGKTISGLKINRTNINVGLFGSVSNAKLKNVTIDSPIINVTGGYAGSLAGSVTGSTVENVTINMPIITGNSYSGGLFGSFIGTVSNVNIIRPVVQSSGDNVGGLIGSLLSNISNITIKEPHVNGRNCVGGIAGTANNDVSDMNVMNPIVEGNNYVGGITGYWNAESSARNKFHSNNCVIGGLVQGSSYVGGILGYGYRSVKQVTSQSYSYSLVGNYSSASISGTNSVGGICGYILSTSWRKKSENVGKNIDEVANFLYNRSDGNVIGNNYVGGICGQVYTENDDTQNSNVSHAGSYKQNVVTGNVSGANHTNGMFGYFSITSTTGGSVGITKNLNTSSIISATNATPTRIGCSGTNYALNTTVLMQGNQQLEVEDGGNNGTGYGQRTLKRKNTYIGFDYDFDTTWAIVDGESFPYSISQSIPATIEVCSSGTDAIISGIADCDGKVYVFLGDRMIEGVVSDGTWSVSLGEVSEGTTVMVSVEVEDKKPSIMVSTEAVHVANTVVELDENSTTIPVNAAGVDVLLKRTINANEWSTICLPFTATGEQVKAAFGDDVQLAAFTAWESEEDENGAIVAINVMFTPANADDGIAANTPMLIRISDAITTATFNGVTVEPEETPTVQVGKRASERGWFRGTYNMMQVPEENLFLSGNKFWYSTGVTTIKGYRGYFEFRDVLDAYYDESEALVKLNIFFDDEESSIKKPILYFSPREEEIYDLQGRKWSIFNGNRSILPKGIYIVNGKKQVIM